MRPSYTITTDSLSATSRPAWYFLLHAGTDYDLAHSDEMFVDEGQAERAAEDAMRMLGDDSEARAFAGLVQLRPDGLARLRACARGFLDDV